MWVFLNNAFLSIVEYRDDPDCLLVRARAGDDIGRVFPGFEVNETPQADYRFRAVIPRAEVANQLAAQVEAINYPNFKSTVRESVRHKAYMRVWSEMEWAYRSYVYLKAAPKPLPKAAHR